MKKKIFGTLAALAAITLLGTGCAKPTATAVDHSPISIGWAGPITGDLASIGTDALKAAQLAVSEINTGGGVNGRPLQLIAEDDKCDAKEASLAGNKLMAVDKVPVIIGGHCSGETLAMAPVAEQTKTVLLSPCSSAPSITNIGDFTFRTYPSDLYQGQFVASYLYNTLGKRRVAVLSIENAWGQGIKETFKTAFQKLGGTIADEENFVVGTTDLRGQLTKIKNSNADIIYFLGENNASSVAGLRQIQELGLNIPVIGGDTWDDAKIWDNAYANGVKFTVPSVNVPSDWRDKMKAAGADVTICAPGAYNNIKIIADIMKRVGTDSTAIKNELYKVKDYPGINGPITLDQNGDLTSASFGVKEIKNGQAEFVAN